MRENPIRRVRNARTPSPRPGGRSVTIIGYWYAVCPECTTEIKPSLPRWKTTRKNAKDALHVHLRQHQAGPGGSSTSLSA